MRRLKRQPNTHGKVFRTYTLERKMWVSRSQKASRLATKPVESLRAALSELNALLRCLIEEQAKTISVSVVKVRGNWQLVVDSTRVK